MKCRHCLVPIVNERERVGVINSDNHLFIIDTSICPKCGKVNVYLSQGKTGPAGVTKDNESEEILLYPKYSPKYLAPKEAPQDIQDDYYQACLIGEISPVASAALSRRCFRKIIRDKGGVIHDVFSKEMQQVLQSKALPTQLHKQIDTLRTLHNYAAHPVFDKNPAILVNVKPIEAELWIEVLNSILQIYYGRK
jgi:hypothetical protein